MKIQKKIIVRKRSRLTKEVEICITTIALYKVTKIDKHDHSQDSMRARFGNKQNVTPHLTLWKIAN